MAGIRNHDVDRTHLVIETAEHRHDPRWVTNVRFDNERTVAKLAHASGRLFRAVGVRSIVDPDVGSGRRQSQRDTLADAAAGTGNQRILSFERDLHDDASSTPEKPLSPRPQGVGRLPARDRQKAWCVARGSA